MEELISIIIPVYNVEEYLFECVKSIVNQTYSKIEIILVNDGSKDNSGKICNDWAKKDDRIRVIHKINAGTACARITGLLNSQAKYIIFVDADDYVDENYVKILYNAMIDNNVDLVTCQFFEFRYGQKQKSDIRCEPAIYDKDKIENLLKTIFLYDKKIEKSGFYPYLCGKIFKREILVECLNVGKDLFYGEDHVCVFKYVYNINSMLIIPNYLYFYRKREGQVTQLYKNELWENMELYFRRIKFIDKNNLLNEQINYWSFKTLITVINLLFSTDKNYSYINNIIIKNKKMLFYKDALKINHKNLKLKRKVQFVLIKNNLFFLYYVIFKLNSFLKK